MLLLLGYWAITSPSLLLLTHSLDRSLVSSITTDCYKLLCKRVWLLLENRLSVKFNKLCSTDDHDETGLSNPSPYLRWGRRKGGFFSGACAPALGGSSECLRGKVPPGIVWQMVWSEASGLWGWSWKQQPLCRQRGREKAPAKWAQPQQRCHLWSPACDDHVQRQAPQPEMWVPGVCCWHRRLLSSQLCWGDAVDSVLLGSRCLLFNSAFLWGFCV